MIIRFLAAGVLALAFLPGLRALEIEEAPIHYSRRAPADRFSLLLARLRAGEVSLRADTEPEALANLLRLLEVPRESQVLVFSKTSAQNSRIAPAHPRAIYFSDDCYVGWVQGGAAEILTFDPEAGGIFHLVDIGEAVAARREPAAERPASCLNCHGRTPAGEIPGGLVRSVHPRPDGLPLFHAGSFQVGPDTEIRRRWGGWYVTGDAGGQTHMGNALAGENASGVFLTTMASGPEPVTDLAAFFDPAPYLGGARSDIVALMVLEHQIAMHNTLVAANLTVRQLAWRTEQIHRSLGEPLPSPPRGVLLRVLQSQADKVVRQLLFADEHLMPGTGVQGDDAFLTAFARNARTTSEGRSLKDFRLHERLFKHRCSYVIHSEVFRHLPPLLRDEVARQLDVALAPEGSDASAHLDRRERELLRAILAETEPGLTAAWNLAARP
jgi:hypothetical protein